MLLLENFCAQKLTKNCRKVAAAMHTRIDGTPLKFCSWILTKHHRKVVGGMYTRTNEGS